MVQDLTSGSITRHLLKTMSFMLVMMIFQTLSLLVDLYRVGRLGTAAVAAVGIAGNLSFAVLALTQMLGVGTTTVVAHAAGQSADAGAARLTGEYLRWFIPAMALQFPLVAMSAALRGIGNFKIGVAVGIVTIVINLLVAPVLIFGWIGAPALGIAGAAIASLFALVIGNVWLALYCRSGTLSFARDEWRPRVTIWKRLLGIGLPAGFDVAMMAVYLFIVYAVTKPFGAAAQAGFGIGMRVMQGGFMPVVATSHLSGHPRAVPLRTATPARQEGSRF